MFVGAYMIRKGVYAHIYKFIYQSLKSLNIHPPGVSSDPAIPNDYHYHHLLPGHTSPLQRCKILVPVLFLLSVSEDRRARN